MLLSVAPSPLWKLGGAVRLSAESWDVSTDAGLHLTPTELHNPADETGTRKPARIQKRWRADTLALLIAATPL